MGYLIVYLATRFKGKLKQKYIIPFCLRLCANTEALI